MLFLPDVSQRRLRPEIIDQPDLDARRHARALEGLERVNFFSRSARIVWRPIESLAREGPLCRLRILDVATGAGDLPIALWWKARRAALEVEIDGCDVSRLAVEYARQQAEEAQAEVRFFQCDALLEPWPGDYDVVISSLFLHHLDEARAVELLRRMAAAAKRLVLVNDLMRSPAGFVLAWLGTRLLTRSDVARADGPRSVEGAFSLDEVGSLCRRAGLMDVTIQRRWPCRFLLTWRRP